EGDLPRRVEKVESFRESKGWQDIDLLVDIRLDDPFPTTVSGRAALFRLGDLRPVQVAQGRLNVSAHVRAGSVDPTLPVGRFALIVNSGRDSRVMKMAANEVGRWQRAGITERV